MGAKLQNRAQEQAHGKLLESRRTKKSQPQSREEGERAQVVQLAETRNQMLTEFERFQDLTASLAGQSKTMSATQDQYQEYESKLKQASQKLGQLKRKMEDDTKYIWYSFSFFI